MKHVLAGENICMWPYTTYTVPARNVCANISFNVYLEKQHELFIMTSDHKDMENMNSAFHFHNGDSVCYHREPSCSYIPRKNWAKILLKHLQNSLF